MLCHFLCFGKALWLPRGIGGPGKEEEEERGGRKEEGKEGKAGSGAQPRRIFLKTRFYPLSGPRWGISFSFLDSSHRDLPFGETPSPGDRLDAKIGWLGQLHNDFLKYNDFLLWQSRVQGPPQGALEWRSLLFLTAF